MEGAVLGKGIDHGGSVVVEGGWSGGSGIEEKSWPWEERYLGR